MLNKPSIWLVTRIRGTKQDYLSTYHLGLGDQISESTWSTDELCAIPFDSEEDAKQVSERFPGTFVQEFMDYEDEDER